MPLTVEMLPPDRVKGMVMQRSPVSRRDVMKYTAVAAVSLLVACGGTTAAPPQAPTQPAAGAPGTPTATAPATTTPAQARFNKRFGKATKATTHKRRHISTLAIVIAAVTLIALFFFGYIKGRFTGMSPFRGAVQTVLIGGAAASAAYGIAKLFR